jgi:hypothetical protein
MGTIQDSLVAAIPHSLPDVDDNVFRPTVQAEPCSNVGSSDRLQSDERGVVAAKLRVLGAHHSRSERSVSTVVVADENLCNTPDKSTKARKKRTREPLSVLGPSRTSSPPNVQQKKKRKVVSESDVSFLSWCFREESLQTLIYEQTRHSSATMAGSQHGPCFGTPRTDGQNSGEGPPIQIDTSRGSVQRLTTFERMTLTIRCGDEARALKPIANLGTNRKRRVPKSIKSNMKREHLGAINLNENVPHGTKFWFGPLEMPTTSN